MGRGEFVMKLKIFAALGWILALWFLVVLYCTVSTDDIRDGVKAKGAAYLISKDADEKVIECK
jgi:hypothetical protein